MKNYEYILKKRLVNYVGWVGYGNLGDELLLDLIKREIEPVLPVYSLTYLNKAYRLRTTIPGFRQSIILGGGTLVFKETFYRRLIETGGDPLHLIGTGVCDVSFWCDYLKHNTVNRSRVRDWTRLLNSAKSISVRGDRSKAQLRANGVNCDIEVIGDPVFLACDRAKECVPDNTTVGINFGITKDLLWGKSDKNVAAEFVKLIRFLNRQDRRVVVYCVSRADYNYVGAIVHEQLRDCNDLKVKLFENYWDYITHVSRCAVFIGEKLHAVALALCGGVPSIMVSYRPKCDDLMSSVGLENLCVRSDEITVERLREMLTHVSGNLEGYRKLIAKRTKELCGVQKGHIKYVAEQICAE